VLDRLLVVGLGSIGRRHARLARALLPGARIVALRHRTGAAEVEPGVERCVTTLAEALAFRPQAAVLANPASLRLDVARALAEAGVHLLIEKPIAHETPGVEELLAMAEARGITVMTGYNLRFAPSLIHFRERVRAAAVGRILSVRVETGQHLASWRPGADYARGVSARRELGGGVLLELSHEIDYVRWLFGEIAWVQATCSRRSALAIDVEESALLSLGIAGEAGLETLVVAMAIDFVRHDSTRQCTVVGEQGTLRWNGITGVVEQFLPAEPEWREVFRHPPQRDETYLAEWNHFLGAMDGRFPVPVTGADGLAALRVVEAARRAAETGSRVAIGIDQRG
jgi:predicted dehydrogenase